MKQGLIGKITAIAALMLCFALIFLAACGGGNGDGGNSGGNSNSVVDGGGSSDSGNGGFTEAVTSAVNDVKEALTGPSNSLTIYKVGNDTLAVAVKSDECKAVMPKGEWEESMDRMTIRTEDYNTQIQLQSFNMYGWYRVNDASDGQNVSSEYNTSVVTEDSYFGFISKDGLWDEFRLNGELTFEIYHESAANYEEILKADASQLVKEVSLEEFADIAAEILNVGKPDHNWAGTFKSDNYGDVTGLLRIDVTEHGGLVFNSRIDGTEKTYIGYEIMPEGWEGGDESWDYRHCVLLNGPGGNERVSFQYTINYWGDSFEDSISWTYDDWSENANSYKSCTFTRFKEAHTAPADYKDEDYNGYIARKDPDDDKYFKPASDDYIINCSINTTAEDLECDYYNLTSFDKNGFLLDYGVTKYVFKSASDAETFVAKRNSNYNNEYYKTDRSDNIVYIAAKEEAGYRTTGSKTAQMSYSGSDWYVNCHYLYGWKRDDGTYGSITYVSKPYTENEFKIALEDQLYWDGIADGDHRSFETKDAVMNLSVGDYTYIGFYGPSIDGTYIASPSEIHITGKTITGASLTSEWENGGTVYYLNFTEILCDEKIADVTQYRFRLEDMYSTEVNFDNFKTMTPTLVIKQTYDMTRAD